MPKDKEYIDSLIMFKDIVSGEIIRVNPKTGIYLDFLSYIEKGVPRYTHEQSLWKLAEAKFYQNRLVLFADKNSANFNEAFNKSINLKELKSPPGLSELFNNMLIDRMLEFKAESNSMSHIINRLEQNYSEAYFAVMFEYLKNYSANFLVSSIKNGRLPIKTIENSIIELDYRVKSNSERVMHSHDMYSVIRNANKIEEIFKVDLTKAKALLK